MTRIPCTECRKREETEAELKALKSTHAKLERRMAKRLHKIGDLQDTVKKLRATVSAMRKMEQRLRTRHDDLLEDRDALRSSLVSIKRSVTRAMEESHLG